MRGRTLPNDSNFQLRIFQNQPNTLDFDKADSMEAAQDVEITEKNLSGDIILLKFVKFQNVTNLQFFFKVYQIQMSQKNRPLKVTYRITSRVTMLLK